MQAGVLVEADTYNDYGDGTADYALGAVLSSTTANRRGGVFAPESSITNTYDWYDGAVQKTVAYRPDRTQAATSTTTYTNAATGVLQSAYVGDGRPRVVTIVGDALGQAIRRDESDNNAQTGDPHEIWFRFDGRQLGYIGNNGTSNADFATTTAERTAAPPTGTPGPFRGGASYATPVADFDQNYDAINSYAQGAAGGGYTVRAGDTLAGIAQGLWGDAALWYKLAEANGLTATAALTDGMRLTVPGGVNKSHNNAGTNRVYDPSDAYGDTSPTSPTTPKPQKKKGCGVLGQIIVTAIAVAITALVPGPGGIIGSALYGAAVSAASQGIGVLIGAQQKISWKGVALAGLTAGITQGVNPGPIAGSAFLGDVVAGAAVNATVQGVALATGLQSKFDFAGVAAAGIGAGVGGAVGGKVGGLGRFGQRLAVGTASGIANAASRSAVNGSSFGDNLMRALPDVIGQTVGGFFADAITGNLPRSARAGGSGSAESTHGGGGNRYLDQPQDRYGNLVDKNGGPLPIQEDEVVVTANKEQVDAIKRDLSLGDRFDRLFDFNFFGRNPHTKTKSESKSYATMIGQGYLQVAAANSYDPRSAVGAYSRWAVQPVSGPIPRSAMSYFPGGAENAAMMSTLGYDTNPAKLGYSTPVTRGEVVDIVSTVAGLYSEVGALSRGSLLAAETAASRMVSTIDNVGSNSGLYRVGAYNEIRGTVPGLDAHHVGQKALMESMIPGYDPLSAPAILVPKAGHTIRSLERGILSRSTVGLETPRAVVARDIMELRRVYPDIPNAQLQQLIRSNKTAYPQSFIKGN